MLVQTRGGKFLERPEWPTATPSDPPAPTPRTAQRTSPVPRRSRSIGEAVAAAATMIACAIEDCRQGGSLAPATKAAGGDRLARVTMLALDHELGDDDFFRTARDSGKKILRQRLNGSSSVRKPPMRCSISTSTVYSK